MSMGASDSGVRTPAEDFAAGSSDRAAGPVLGGRPARWSRHGRESPRTFVAIGGDFPT
jgi:hypothetical protein